MIAERYKGKCGPISFEEMYELLLKRQRDGKRLARSDEHWELWGYGPDVEDTAVRRRDSDFNEWLRQEHGLEWGSTRNTALYPAGTIEPRRPRQKKTPSSFDPSE
jgi:hypothetical protein